MVSCQIIQTGFDQHRDAISAIRQQVFIEEQHVPPELEWDSLDDQAIHLLAITPEQQAVGTVRLLKDGHIGRMAVLLPYRQQGIGSALLETILVIAKQQGLNKVFLNAQTTAIAFYHRFGFQETPEIFMDAGIPHQYMSRNID